MSRASLGGGSDEPPPGALWNRYSVGLGQTMSRQ